ncbi:hypothetical protein [Spirosoma foliorum]|uniref:Uncharacterized protein n=1 Tax=Spirosoma foliorum TaxID=2710596 RepID=A0A7G5GXU2_9BACT|nr:hypothetical protein [Spirosoma foliorum]QMW03684.1 hypothetical protein H3H32_01635 [Spirosoma foliorum]
MITSLNHPNPSGTALVDARIGGTDADTIKNQNGDETEEEAVNEELDDEPVDEDGDPTGEHDHHQDDNYALGGHVTRSGSV